MSTLTLAFTLPDDQAEATLATRGADYFDALYAIVSELRRRVKYETSSEDLDAFYAWMWRALTERGIDPFSE
jgi:flagellin-specific chaperone FliS